MIFFLIFIMSLFSLARADQSVTQVCLRTNYGERQIPVATVLLERVMEQHPGSFIGECVKLSEPSAPAEESFE